MAQLIAKIGIGNQVVQNDFGNMPIYKDIPEEDNEGGGLDA